MNTQFLPANDRYLIIGIILLLVVAIRGAQFFLMRKKDFQHLPAGEPRSYGLGGGAVCPKCRRPFPLSLLECKIGFGARLARCPFCGKWSFVQRLGIDDLRAAETAELAEAEAAQPFFTKSEEDKLKDLIDESRYSDQK